MKTKSNSTFKLEIVRFSFTFINSYRLKDAEKEEKPAQIEVEKEEPKKMSNKATSGEQEFQNYQYTYDLIYLYNNLNHKYRTEAFDALELADSGTQNVYEFKIKLLFSVIVVSL